jgi:hypothetical protein
MARRGNRFYRQAELEALVRYGPELSALMELQRSATKTFRGAKRSAKANSRAIVNAVNKAAPRVDEIYDDAGESLAAYQTAAGGAVAPGSPAALEQAAAAERIAEARALVESDLESRKVGAREGRQFAVQQARSEFADAIGAVLRRRTELGREIGAYTALTGRELRQDALERRQDLKIAGLQLNQQERNSLRSAGLDPDTGSPIPGGRLDQDANGRPGDQSRGANGKKPKLTQLQRNRASEQYDSAFSRASTLRSSDIPFEAALRALTEGVPGKDPVQKYDPQTGKKLIGKNGEPVMTPGRPEVKPVNAPPLLVRAALEVAYFGYVRRDTAKKLRRQGINPKRVLGVPQVGYQGGGGSNVAGGGPLGPRPN